MKPLLTYHLRQILYSPATGLFLTCGWVGAILLTFTLGGFMAANRANLSILFTYLPWIMAILIPALTMNIADEPRRGITERLLTLPHTPAARLFSRFLVLWALIGAWLLGFWPMVATLFYLGSPEVGPILTGLLGNWLLAAPMLAASILVCRHIKGGAIAGLLGSAAVCAVMLALGAPTTLSWLGPVLPQSILATLSTLSPLSAAAPLMDGLLPLPSIAAIVALTAALLAASLPLRTLTTAILAVIAVITLSLALTPSLSMARLDATSDGRYTLAPVTRQILRTLPDTITFTLYASQNNPDVPATAQATITAMKQLLRSIHAANPAHIKVEVVNVDASTANAVQALQAGVTEQPLPGGTSYFAGLVAQSGGRSAAIARLTRQRRPFQEFDVMDLLTQTRRARQPSVMLVSAAEFTPAPQWLRALQSAYTVLPQPAAFSQVPPEVDVLLIMGNPALPPQSISSIRQYLGTGGKVVLVADSLWRTRPESAQPPAEHAQPLTNILPEWGLEYHGDVVVADPAQPTVVTQAGIGTTSYPFWLSLTAANVNNQLPFTSFINKVLWAEGAALTLTTANPAFTVTPVLVSGPQTQAMPLRQFLSTPAELAVAQLNGKPASRLLAAMVTGNFEADSTRPGTLMVFTDADWLADRFAVQGRAPGASGNNNLALFANALQYLVGETALTQLRGKGVTPRTLTRVEDTLARLTRQSTLLEQKLAAQLYQVSLRLADMQQTAPAQLTGAQQSELAAFRAEQFTLRQQLRGLRQNTRRHLQLLENALLLINLAAMPTVTGALFLAHRRRQRRRAVPPAK